MPLWNIPVFLSYAPRRVQCPGCGVKVEEVPWAEGKNRHCTVYEWFLAAWAKLLAWQQVARSFGMSWNTEGMNNKVKLTMKKAYAIAVST